METIEDYFHKCGLRYFEEFPEDMFCPICNTNEEDYCVLIGVDGTSDGNIEEGKPVHLHCLLRGDKIRINTDFGFVYQRTVCRNKK